MEKITNQTKPNLDNYTNAAMPDIQDEAPLSLLEGISKDQLLAWLQTATGKVLVCPFNTEVRHQPNHVEIVKSLIAATNDIMGQLNVVVAAPIRDKEALDEGKHPYTFLIHNLTPKNVLTLLERRVWSLTEISFRVSPLNPSKLDFLFTLIGLLTPEPAHVQHLLTMAWRDQVMEAFIKNLITVTFRLDFTYFADTLDCSFPFSLSLSPKPMYNMNLTCSLVRYDLPIFNSVRYYLAVIFCTILISEPHIL